MTASAITTRVADLIRNPKSAMPNEWERSIQKKQTDTASSDVVKREAVKSEPAVSQSQTQNITLNSGDTLTLSPLAQRILEDSDSSQSDWEKFRNERVQRVQQLVQERQYTIAPEIVDGIAQKIVAMLP